MHGALVVTHRDRQDDDERDKQHPVSRDDLTLLFLGHFSAVPAPRRVRAITEDHGKKKKRRNASIDAIRVG
jgi:hypothetical protein